MQVQSNEANQRAKSKETFTRTLQASSRLCKKEKRVKYQWHSERQSPLHTAANVNHFLIYDSDHNWHSFICHQHYDSPLSLAL